MMDGDGAEMVEMMAGQPAEAILATMYNGSGTCLGCGALMNPVSVMYSGNRCSDCSSKTATSRVKNRMAG
jgi:DNA-directed RNA polymerase subunit RPC12/RpoP